jgi:hypothetical protein
MCQHARQRPHPPAAWFSVLTAVKKLCAGIGHCERRHKSFTLDSQQVLSVHVGHKCALVFCLGICHLLACSNQSAA